MGIAQRQIHIKLSQKQGRINHHSPLSVNIKTIGDWIKVKRTEKNLTSGHVAAKMGIAQSMVRSWERGASLPDKRQLAVLRGLLGFDPRKEATLVAIISPCEPGDQPAGLHPMIEVQPV